MMLGRKKKADSITEIITNQNEKEKPSLREVLTNRSYLLVISGQILAVVSNILAFTPIAYIIYQTTQSA